MNQIRANSTATVPILFLAQCWWFSAADALYYKKSDEVRGITVDDNTSPPILP